MNCFAIMKFYNLSRPSIPCRVDEGFSQTSFCEPVIRCLQEHRSLSSLAISNVSAIKAHVDSNKLEVVGGQESKINKSHNYVMHLIREMTCNSAKSHHVETCSVYLNQNGSGCKR